MLKATLATLAAALPLVWLLPPEASAQSSSGARAKQSRAQAARRPAQAQQHRASVGSNGLCQRDTGTPTSQLDFRNRCDTEEFWRRIMDAGGSAEK